jgi:hypothetical protein
VLTPAASLLLWAFILPLCFLCSLAVVVAGIVENEREASLPDFFSLLPARAPPVVS